MTFDPWRYECVECENRTLRKRSYGYWCCHCDARVPAVDLKTGEVVQPTRTENARSPTA